MTRNEIYTDDFTQEEFDFDAQDVADAERADSLRSLVYGLPTRPGTRR